MTAPQRRGPRHLTVQGWQFLVLSVMGVVVLIAGITVAVLLNRTDAVSGELIGKIQPSRVAAYQMQAALRDQETAVRGYVIAADPRFLEPYFAGRRTEQQASAELRQLEQDRPDLLDDLDAIHADAQRTLAAGHTDAGVVIGGGLLGLEAANALRSFGVTAHVVEMAPRLMAQQLDEAGGALLGRMVTELGITVHSGVGTESIKPAGRSSRKRLMRDGSGPSARSCTITG